MSFCQSLLEPSCETENIESSFSGNNNATLVILSALISKASSG